MRATRACSTPPISMPSSPSTAIRANRSADAPAPRRLQGRRQDAHGRLLPRSRRQVQRRHGRRRRDDAIHLRAGRRGEPGEHRRRHLGRLPRAVRRTAGRRLRRRDDHRRFGQHGRQPLGGPDTDLLGQEGRERAHRLARGRPRDPAGRGRQVLRPVRTADAGRGAVPADDGLRRPSGPRSRACGNGGNTPLKQGMAHGASTLTAGARPGVHAGPRLPLRRAGQSRYRRPGSPDAG